MQRHRSKGAGSFLVRPARRNIPCKLEGLPANLTETPSLPLPGCLRAALTTASSGCVHVLCGRHRGHQAELGDLECLTVLPRAWMFASSADPGEC